SSVNSLASDDNFIYAATESGVFKRPRSISAVVERPSVPSSFMLKQNYPNPFNPATTIEYEVSSKQYVALKVYNVLGQKVALLVNGEQSPGYYKVNFDASRLPSGVYFYRLEAGSYSATKKMVLIR
ncbi:MAG: T9SS type A sorting domain-containing protein, partial [Bacteroidetes bacterium]|nr:T9SS type A sorting domain-containing protein [Bacteroidota bacterium]